MTLLKTLFIFWVFWWMIKKLLSYFENNSDQHLNFRKSNDRNVKFKERNLDVQDGEFEEIDESH